MVPPSPLVSRVFGEQNFHTESDIAAIEYAADGSLWSIDEVGLLRRWSPTGKVLERHFLSDLETLWAFGPRAELLASGKDDLLLWEVASGQLLGRIEQHSWVTAIAFSADNRTLATGHDDGVVRFWDTRSRRHAGQLTVCPGMVPVSAIAFSPRGDLVAAVGEDRVIRVWNQLSHKLACELTGHTDRVPSLAWRPDGDRLVSAGWDASIRVWRPPQTAPTAKLATEAEQVHLCAFSRDGRLLACADSNFEIHLWSSLDSKPAELILRGHTEEIRSLTFNSNGSLLASAGADRVIHVWDARTGKLVAGPNLAGRNSVAVIPGEPLRVAVSSAPTVRVWDADTGKECEPRGLGSAVSIAAAPSGKWLALGGTDHFTRLWNLHEDRQVAALEATKPPIGFLTFSFDSTHLAHTSTSDGLVWIWNCETATPELIIIEAADGCTLEGLAFHPDGKRIAVGGVDYLSTGKRTGAVCVWDIPSKDKLFTLDTGVYAVAFDPQGKYLAGGGFDEAVYLWDVETRETVFILGGHQGKIHTVAFNPDGSYLLSGGEDGTIRVWDVLSGRFLVAREFDSPIQSLAFSPDGSSLFCGNGNTTCYRIEFAKLLEE
jgi:WD40 repeat protein